MANLGAIVVDTSAAVIPNAERLVGRYVTLRRMEETDFPSLWHTTGAHESVFTYWPVGPFRQSSDFTESLTRVLEEEPGLVIYTVLKGDEAVGCLFILPTDLENRVMEMGALYGPSLQKTREATEAIYLGASLAFDQCNSRRLAWKTSRVNTPSQRAAERWGFTFEGCLRQVGIQQGRNRDTMWYSIIDGEWLACKRVLDMWLDGGNFDEQGNQKMSLEEIRNQLRS